MGGGRYQVVLARTEQEVRLAQRLRRQVYAQELDALMALLWSGLRTTSRPGPTTT